MVDFNELRDQRQHARPIDPIEIFLRLPKTPGLDDLWNSQAQALSAWFDRRDQQDLVVKLNTGGGKTLVGLLIAQSTMHERGPALYLSPNNLLVDQTLTMARQYGVPAVRYVSGEAMDAGFLDGQAIMVATYAALFNGQSRFGVAGGRPETVFVETIILDDAHTAFSEIRERFTISIPSGQPMYSELVHLFRSDFGEIGRQGTFDDVVAGRDLAVLDVPYWSWLSRVEEIRERLATDASDKFPFVWPLLRDAFRVCHALISSSYFCITPILPMVDMFPTFANCRRRVYMSATVADDSSIVRTFDAQPKSISAPISPTSLAGVGERMILVPELMILPRKDTEAVVDALAQWVSEKFGGAVIITPSRARADRWDATAKVVQGDDVAVCVDSLRNGTTRGPYAFPSRYDGIDLPGDSCRLLILDGLPRGTSSYDLYRAAVLEGSSAINASIAQRVEQGMGRGTRGGGDHCVVILTGRDLVTWISRTANLNLLTPSTRAQLSMGLEVSRNVGSPRELAATMSKCLSRSADWVEYHAEVIADAAGFVAGDVQNLAIAECERRFFRLVRDGYYEKAISVVERFVEDNGALSSQVKGWLLQLAAWAAELWDNGPRANALQQGAFGHNRALTRPKTTPVYVPLSAPSGQSENIVRLLSSYTPRSGVRSYFEEIADWLTATASSNQFEESMKKLGEIMGFHAERPDHDIGIGPDVLWVMSADEAWVIEAKSQKNADNPLTKSEHGQLLEAFEWFRRQYPKIHGTKVVVHPNAVSSENVAAQDTSALTLPSLLNLIPRVRQLLSDLSAMPVQEPVLAARCDQRLRALELTPDGLAAAFLESFTVRR